MQFPTPFIFEENAFDDVEQLFRGAYVPSDPTPELLNLMKAHPGRLPRLTFWSISQKPWKRTLLAQTHWHLH